MFQEDFDEIRPDFVNDEEELIEEVEIPAEIATTTTAGTTTTSTSRTTKSPFNFKLATKPTKRIELGALSRDIQTSVKTEEFHELVSLAIEESKFTKLQNQYSSAMRRSLRVRNLPIVRQLLLVYKSCCSSSMPTDL